MVHGFGDVGAAEEVYIDLMSRVIESSSLWSEATRSFKSAFWTQRTALSWPAAITEKQIPAKPPNLTRSRRLICTGKFPLTC